MTRDQMIEAARTRAIEYADDAQDFTVHAFPCGNGALCAFTRLRENGADLYAQIVNDLGESLGCYSLTKPRVFLDLFEQPNAGTAARIRHQQDRVD